jgi:sodium-dependent dicarboxylate transporter 2/3/5
VFKASANLISQEVKKLGKVSKEEKRVLLIFAIMVFLWITRTVINKIFPDLKLSDTVISLIGAVSLFAIPMNLKKGNFILQWKDTEKLAWGILLLFGGGLALAKGMASSGLVALITNTIASGNFNILVTVSLLIILMLFMTELMSNVALVAVLAPVVAGIAVGLNIPILNLLIPVTMASSCAFMLPMATPPNAIVFASGYVKVNEMVKAGIILNMIAVGLLILYYQFVIPLFF